MLRPAKKIGDIYIKSDRNMTRALDKLSSFRYLSTFPPLPLPLRDRPRTGKQEHSSITLPPRLCSPPYHIASLLLSHPGRTIARESNSVGCRVCYVAMAILEVFTTVGVTVEKAPISIGVMKSILVWGRGAVIASAVAIALAI
ncbi:hypothetical protein GGR51DRAFT_526698 [Nemania sp. FL0031]|nr:hypothetical protein GGR51DRAFT_526698 [Nemania sp. FL0031]